MTITAIRNLGSDGGDGSRGVHMKLQADGSKIRRPVWHMEVCFEDRAKIGDDRGVQRTPDINGDRLVPMRPMVQLQH